MDMTSQGTAYGRFTRAVTVQKPLIEVQQLLTLGLGFTGNSELRQNEIEHLIRIHPRIKEKRRSHPPLMEPLEKLVYQRGFSRAHFTGESDKAFAILDAIHQAAQRLFDLFG